MAFKALTHSPGHWRSFAYKLNRLLVRIFWWIEKLVDRHTILGYCYFAYGPSETGRDPQASYAHLVPSDSSSQVLLQAMSPGKQLFRKVYCLVVDIHPEEDRSTRLLLLKMRLSHLSSLSKPWIINGFSSCNLHSNQSMASSWLRSQMSWTENSGKGTNGFPERRRSSTEGG